jgi:hypothetical protein
MSAQGVENKKLVFFPASQESEEEECDSGHTAIFLAGIQPQGTGTKRGGASKARSSGHSCSTALGALKSKMRQGQTSFKMYPGLPR